MLIGYARTSTFEQVAGFDQQKAELQSAGAKRIYAEQISSVAKRPQLAAAIDQLRSGDVLLVTKLDRLARSMRDLLEIVAQVEAHGATLKVLAMGLDTSSATGKLMMNVLGSVAEFERCIMLERQREGIAKAKSEGRYRGRKPTARAKRDDVLKLHAQKVGAGAIAKALNIGRASVYRVLADAKAS